MKVLAFALSLRQGSFNKKLLNLAVESCKAQSVEIEVLSLLDYELPAYSEDIQNRGFPETAERFKQKLETADALIIASPEYNFSYPGHFKNTFDWISRFQPMPWAKKAVLLISASPSLVGGNRGLWHLRVPFEACGAFVYPDMYSIASAHQAFDEEGNIKDPNLLKRLQNLIPNFLKFAQGLKT